MAGNTSKVLLDNGIRWVATAIPGAALYLLASKGGSSPLVAAGVGAASAVVGVMAHTRYPRVGDGLVIAGFTGMASGLGFAMRPPAHAAFGSIPQVSATASNGIRMPRDFVQPTGALMGHPLLMPLHNQVAR